MSFRWRVRLSAVGVLFVAYVALFWVMGCADHLILHPTRDPIPVPNGTRTTIPFGPRVAGGGGGAAGVLEIWVGHTRVRATEQNAAYVLEFSPNAGRAEWGLLYGTGKWEGLPVEYWSLNYPGYGGSDGPATLEGVQRSALAAYDALAERAQGKPIFLSGYSLGTTAALHVASQREVAGLYLHHPVPLRQLIVGKYGWWNLWLAALPVARGVPSELDTLANGAKCRAPAFFVLGQNDTFVNYPYQQRVATAYSGPKRLLPLPVNHNDDAEEMHRAEIREGVRWLWQQAGLTEGLPTTREVP
jgi:hypothetical protein